MVDIKLPELGEGVTEGELIKWLVKPGDKVAADQSIAELMTDKATVEVPSPSAGVVNSLKFKVGDIIKVESVILTLEAASQAAKAPSATPTKSAAPLSASSPAAAAMKSTGEILSVKLPELGEGVTEGELVKWLVKPGDMISADQSVAELMTDKATVEVPSPVAGRVKDLKYKVGEIVKVESILLTLEASGSAVVKGALAAPRTSAQAPMQPAAPLAARTSSGGTDLYPPAAELRVLATPATRRLAREMGVNINVLSGTGLAGRVTRDDVLSTPQSSNQAAAMGSSTVASGIPFSQQALVGIPRSSSSDMVEERVPLRGIRKKIAENLQMAKAIIPHFTIMDEADVTELVTLRESLKEFAAKNGTKVTFLPFVIKAMISTIREFPTFNASIDDKASEIVYKKYFNIGFAADTPNGLVVPVIKNADQKSILEISREILDLAKRAREGKLKSEEMKGATITITNIGSVGGTYATPIINHPEVAILGMYKIQEKPVIRNGALAAQKVMNYTVTADHRLIDGAVAANFLKAFIQRIENPASLMMEMR